MLSVQDRESVIQLKLIGQLKVGDKINTRYLEIQPDSFATKLSRYMYGENRGGSVAFCRSCICQTREILKKNNDPKVIEIIGRDLEQAKLGIVALQQTYIADVRVHAELEQIIQSLDAE